MREKGKDANKQGSKARRRERRKRKMSGDDACTAGVPGKVQKNHTPVPSELNKNKKTHSGSSREHVDTKFL